MQSLKKQRAAAQSRSFSAAHCACGQDFLVAAIASSFACCLGSKARYPAVLHYLRQLFFFFLIMRYSTVVVAMMLVWQGQMYFNFICVVSMSDLHTCTRSCLPWCSLLLHSHMDRWRKRGKAECSLSPSTNASLRSGTTLSLTFGYKRHIKESVRGPYAG